MCTCITHVGFALIIWRFLLSFLILLFQITSNRFFSVLFIFAFFHIQKKIIYFFEGRLSPSGENKPNHFLSPRVSDCNHMRKKNVQNIYFFSLDLHIFAALSRIINRWFLFFQKRNRKGFSFFTMNFILYCCVKINFFVDW